MSQRKHTVRLFIAIAVSVVAVEAAVLHALQVLLVVVYQLLLTSRLTHQQTDCK